MARNIVFIILFVVLYGGLFFLGTTGGDEITDRSGYGEFSENHYSCEACNFEMEFDSNWIPLDSTAIKNSYSEYELNDYFGEDGTYDILVGFNSPNLYMECVRYKNINMPKDSFTNSYLSYELDRCKENISLAGGVLGSYGSNVHQAVGNGENMGVYYYDYKLDNELYSEFNCYLNCGKDTLWFYGYYNNKEGLDDMKTFIAQKLTFNSSSQQTV